MYMVMLSIEIVPHCGATSFISMLLEARGGQTDQDQHRDATNYVSRHLETFMSCEFNFIEVSRHQVHNTELEAGATPVL